MENRQKLEAHATKTIDLVSSKRITQDNAFEVNTDFIASMGSLVGQKQNSNWERVSSSIDATSKIYALRVDNVLRKTFQMKHTLSKAIEIQDEPLLERKRRGFADTLESNTAKIDYSNNIFKNDLSPFFSFLRYKHKTCFMSLPIDDSNSVLFSGEPNSQSVQRVTQIEGFKLSLSKEECKVLDTNKEIESSLSCSETSEIDFSVEQPVRSVKSVPRPTVKNIRLDKGFLGSGKPIFTVSSSPKLPKKTFRFSKQNEISSESIFSNEPWKRQSRLAKKKSKLSLAPQYLQCFEGLFNNIPVEETELKPIEEETICSDIPLLEGSFIENYSTIEGISVRTAFVSILHRASKGEVELISLSDKDFKVRVK